MGRIDKTLYAHIVDHTATSYASPTFLSTNKTINLWFNVFRNLSFISHAAVEKLINHEKKNSKNFFFFRFKICCLFSLYKYFATKKKNVYSRNVINQKLQCLIHSLK